MNKVLSYLECVVHRFYADNFLYTPETRRMIRKFRMITNDYCWKRLMAKAKLGNQEDSRRVEKPEVES